MKGPRRTLRTIFAWPALLAAATCIGLVAGLMGEGGWDALACAGLLLPAMMALKAR